MCCCLVRLQGDNQFTLLLPSLIMDLPRELLPRICSSCRSSLTIIHSVVQYYNNFSDIRPFQYKVFLSIFVLHYFKINMFPKQRASLLCSLSSLLKRGWGFQDNWVTMAPLLIEISRESMTNFNSSVQFSRSVVSYSLRPHESQHARPPYPSPNPRVHSDSRPSSQ